MLDFIKAILVIALALGLWGALPVFAILVGTGGAIMMLYAIIKASKEEDDNQPKQNP